MDKVLAKMKDKNVKTIIEQKQNDGKKETQNDI